ncbi:putative LRR receptor-like serine/threonine-protein kinase [Vitis vinifera]|uniref:non-specific serine/threonine protein kinase n=1 Tax=Vitis vinifera TaxID=29760 RepID=A0A438JX14_VITVI|nr:putative LRR receptor-like serine/threonine-protein kinase [Vitis vinifera]
MVSASLGKNNFSGNLPPNFVSHLPNLEDILLGINRLSGIIPSSIGNASKLRRLDLSHNAFTGSIPHALGMAEKLDITLNPLIGILPTSIGNLSTSLELFQAAACDLKGNIPTEIGNLSNLYQLSLDNNDLIGTIPPSIGQLQKLQGLYLSENKLQGSIPNDICQLRNLVELLLANNQLSGSIPACFGELAFLRDLYLGSNKLNSTIPLTLWSLNDILSLDMSSNFLVGYLPLDMGNLKVLVEINLSRNQLSGEIPSNIGGLPDLIRLSLAHNRFEGPILHSFSNLKSLEFMDLSDNALSGEIPRSLQGLIYLKYLNVSFNRLYGEIPTEGPFANFSAESFMMNEALCGSPRLKLPPCRTGTHRSTTISWILLKYILLAIASTLLLLALIFVWTRCRKRNSVLLTQAESLPLATWRRISYQEIFQATNGFSGGNLLGSGSFGSVYRGTLSDGKDAAIKVFNSLEEATFKSFDAECEVMCHIRHRNIVKIISSCSNSYNDFKALVLEYVPNGSLEKWLYSHNYHLDILQRLNIMIDVAYAMEYLHHGCSTPVVHCDLKPSNILLDEDFGVHIGDFGIAKLLGQEESMRKTQTLATIGYMAPEYGSNGIVTTSGDVYSYGIVLMETFTRRRPTDETFSEEMSMKNWVWDSLCGSITEVVDTNLLRGEDEQFMAKKQCISSILGLAMDCVADSPEERIHMKDVVNTLKKIKLTYLASRY